MNYQHLYSYKLIVEMQLSIIEESQDYLNYLYYIIEWCDILYDLLLLYKFKAQIQ